MQMRAILLTTALISTSAWAGVDTSGGGNTVVCFDSAQTRQAVYQALVQAENAGINATNPFSDPAVLQSIRSIESLDLYLHRLPRGRNQDQFLSTVAIDPAMSGDQVFEFLLNRIEQKNDFPADVRSQLSSLTWIAADGVARIADTGLPVLFASDCLVAQTAYRKNSQIFFDRHLFNRLDSFNKAILVLHEVLYSIAKEEGAKDPTKVYELISWFIRQELPEFNSVAFARDLIRMLYASEEKTLSIPSSCRYGDQPIACRQKVNRNGHESTFLNDNIDLNIHGFNLHLIFGSEFVEWSAANLNLADGTVVFPSKGRNSVASLRVGTNHAYQLHFSRVQLYSNPTDFMSPGTSGILATYIPISVNNAAFRITAFRLEKGSKVDFYKDSLKFESATVAYTTEKGTQEIKLEDAVLGDFGRALSGGTLTEDVTIGSYFHGRKHFKAGSKVVFNAEGEMTLAK